MKFLVLVMCICAASAATISVYRPKTIQAITVSKPSAPVVKTSSSSDVEAEVLRSDIDVQPDGFAYTYETGNGIAAAATGTLKTVDQIDTLTVQGSYQYVGSDGVPVQVEYVADENGYQPKSDLLPVPPPIPVAIARSLEYIAAHPPPVKESY